MKTPLPFACLTLALCCLVTSATASTLRTVVLSDTPAPGTSSEVNFSGFGNPVLNDAGQAAFDGALAGEGVVFGSNSSGIWSEGGGSGLVLVARSGDVAPGTSGDIHFAGFFTTPVLNDAGQTAFSGGLTGIEVGSFNSSGIWSEGGGSGLTLIAREGNLAPDTSGGGNFFGLQTPLLNDAGQTAFKSALLGTGV